MSVLNWVDADQEVHFLDLSGREVVRFGRGPGVEVVVPGAFVAPLAAVLRKAAGGWALEPAAGQTVRDHAGKVLPGGKPWPVVPGTGFEVGLTRFHLHPVDPGGAGRAADLRFIDAHAA